jgi:microsomal dipeptidase-like Zn-dependent dipeptidase
LDPSRRKFLNDIMKYGAGLLSFGPLLILNQCGPKPRITTDRTFRRVLCDLHAHVMMNQWNRQTPAGRKYPLLETIAREMINLFKIDFEHCHEAGVDVICATHLNVFDEWLSMPTDPNPEAPFHTIRMLDQLEAELNGRSAAYARMAKNGTELAALVQMPKTDPSWRTAVVHAIEGGHALGGDLSALATFADRGVAMIAISHFFNKGIASAPNSFPFFPDAGAGWPNQGLSEFGRDVVIEMERLGMIVDVTHCSTTAVEDVLKIARRPLVASHVGAYTLSDHPLSVIDEHLQEISSRGGMIGIIIDSYLTSNYLSYAQSGKEGTLRDVVRAIRYVYKLCGRKHVGIGSDASGYISPPKDMGHLSEIGKLRSLLIEEFGDHDIVDDILANNAIDFLTTNWGKRG